MKESFITEVICHKLKRDGYKIAVEVPNFNRSADIAAISPCGEVLVIECKVSDIKQAVVQSITHRISADRVMIATYRKKLRSNTFNNLKQHNIGLYLVDENGSVEVGWQPTTREAIWPLRREQLRTLILEEQET
ncbi:hypothetical protein SDC9_16346 [bioreactor metagenome]|jgi:hypothetical protein|uniref:Restriction endonuclease type IV Mrr domain-containing protein n=1 Tax=bioreactor metagenome TaxID=1076179 RepID=A0A644TUB9_9ZZZZ|nr:hypothetical protein [Sphingobacteriia bacterium]